MGPEDRQNEQGGAFPIPPSEDLGPPLDERAWERLYALARGDLPDVSAHVLSRLILTYPSWGAAFEKVMKDLEQTAPSTSQPNP